MIVCNIIIPIASNIVILSQYHLNQLIYMIVLNYISSAGQIGEQLGENDIKYFISSLYQQVKTNESYIMHIFYHFSAFKYNSALAVIDLPLLNTYFQ